MPLVHYLKDKIAMEAIYPIALLQLLKVVVIYVLKPVDVKLLHGLSMIPAGHQILFVI